MFVDVEDLDVVEDVASCDTDGVVFSELAHLDDMLANSR